MVVHHFANVASGPRVVLGVAVGIAHVLVIATILSFGSSGHSRGASEPTWMTAEIVYREPDWNLTTMPEVELERVTVNTDALEIIQFDEPDAGALGKITTRFSSPLLSRFQAVRAEDFARRAGVAPGQSAVTMLMVEILPDGLAGSVSVIQSSGDTKVDAAAVDYALALRWIPGTRDRVPQTMRVRLPVDLSIRSR